MSKQPTVLFIVPSAYLLGGVQVWLEYLINGLNQAGLKSVCGAVDGKYHSAATYCAYYQFAHVAHIRNPMNTRWGRVQAIAATIAHTQADIVVSVNVPDSYEGTQLARQQLTRPLKLVASVHGLEPDYYADIDYAQSYIDAVLVTNKLTSTAIKAFTKVPAEHIYYAPYGVQLPSESVALQPNLRAAHVDPEKGNSLTILFSGRIETEQKRCQDLVGIVAELQAQGVRFKLLIAGEGEYLAELTTLLEDQIAHNAVTFLGFVERDQLLDSILPQCDAMLITSSWETGPIVAWEAMAAGVAVVSSRYLGLAQEAALIDQQNCLLFDIGDVHGAAKVLASLQDSNLRHVLATAARELVAARYTIARSVSATVNVLQQIWQQPERVRAINNISAHWPMTGRLERWFGHRVGHRLRCILGLRATANSAGSEWPHTLGYNRLSQAAFREQLLQESRHYDE